MSDDNNQSTTVKAKLRLVHSVATPEEPVPGKDGGEALRRNKDGTHSKRVRVGGQRFMLRIPLLSARAAKERGELLAALAYRMTLAKADTKLAYAALKRIAAQKAVTERAAFQSCDELVAGFRPESNCPTFAAVCIMWNGNTHKQGGTVKPNELHRQFPDDVPLRNTESTIPAAIRTLDKWILPRIGELPIDHITFEVAEEIKKSLPHHLSADYRRQILTPFKTVIDMCVYPLRYIERSPLPEGWLPSTQGPRDLQWLRPAEDLALMQCTAIPLCWRVLWGYYTRNGSRLNEALKVALGQFDLGAKPMVTLFRHQTKTQAQRFWSLDKTRSSEGLRRWVALGRAAAKPTDYMFVNEEGRRIVDKTVKLPKKLRAHLKLAGITRVELFVSTKTSRNICPHDLRATCITVRLACKWTEADIMQVTGHETSTQLAAYKRAAKLLEDIEAGDFVPLHLAIPELAAAAPSAYWRPELDCSPTATTEAATAARGRLRGAAAAGQLGTPQPEASGFLEAAGAPPGSSAQRPPNAAANAATSHASASSMVEQLHLAEVDGTARIRGETRSEASSGPLSSELVGRRLTSPEQLRLQLSELLDPELRRLRGLVKAAKERAAALGAELPLEELLALLSDGVK